MRRLPILHPAALAAAAVMALNDHVLKHAYPGLVSGKLSDVCGMIFFPLLLASLSRRRHALVVACVLTAVVFALTKTTPWANELYRVAWGAMQWPLRAARALAEGRPLPGIARVVLVRDPTDLVAVPFVLLSLWLGRRDAHFARQSGPPMLELPCAKGAQSLS